MSYYNAHRDMILMVARKLGPKLLKQVAFLGGCTTGLHITDAMTRESVRYTEDVDVIIHVLGYSGWNNFCEAVQSRGFRISMEDQVNCRFRLDSLVVDFMPDNEAVLGYTNRWYRDALKAAAPYRMNDDVTIRLVTPWYFLATKFEAYKGRGRGNLLASRDMEDILNLVNGREELLNELRNVKPELKCYLAAEFSQLLKLPDLIYLVQSAVQGDVGRERVVMGRMESFAELDMR